MQVFTGTDAVFPDTLDRAVVTIGNFDGCHLGHQEIFRRTRTHAARIGGVSVVFTFHPHPASVVKGITPQLIFTLEEKIGAVESLGMDCLIIAPFTREFADPARVFVKRPSCAGSARPARSWATTSPFGRRLWAIYPSSSAWGPRFFVGADPVSVDGQVI